MVAVVLFVLIGFGIGIRFVCNLAKKQSIDEAAMKNIKEKRVVDTELKTLEVNDTDGNAAYNSAAKLNVREYEEQYNPAHDFAIFQRTDPPEWGMKVNRAAVEGSTGESKHFKRSPTPGLPENREIEVEEDSE